MYSLVIQWEEAGLGNRMSASNADAASEEPTGKTRVRTWKKGYGRSSGGGGSAE